MSSPWNALLESLHSAFIDELNDRYPDEKPSLGLPLRRAGFDAPQGVTGILVHEVRMPGVALPGVVFLAVEGGASGDPEINEIWVALLRRCKNEFEHRKILPQLTPIDTAEAKRRAIGKSVWIPLELKRKWYVGIGV